MQSAIKKRKKEKRLQQLRLNQKKIRRSKEAVRLAVLKVNRRLLNLLNQEGPHSNPNNLQSTFVKNISQRKLHIAMSRENSSRSILSSGGGMNNGDAAPKGLPGFLRRSIRNTMEDDDTTLQSRSQGQSNIVSPSDSTVSESSSSVPNEGGSASNGMNAKMAALSVTAPIKPSSSSNSLSSPPQSTTAATNGDKSTTTNTANLTKKSNKSKSYKEATFENCITSPIVDLRDLRRLGWNGIPPEYRAEAWQILLGYLPGNSSRRKATLERKRQEYRDAIAQHYDIDDQTRTVQEQETLRQVLVDVPRTAPDVGLFRSNRIRRILARLLYIWAMRHPASSYVQGINDLVTPLIAVFLSRYYGGKDVTDGIGIEDVPDETLFEVEADAYWCLTKLLAGIQDHYTSDQPGVQRMVFRLEELVRRIDSDLCDYLEATGIEFIQFSFKWMNCLLLREFSLQCIMRLWDTYLSEGDGGFEDFHVYVCSAFLCQFSAEVQQMEFDELFSFMQNTPTEDWGDAEIEVLLSQAFVLSTLFGGSDAHLTSGT